MANAARHDQLQALNRVRDELDAWGDYEQSESSEEHFPESIDNDKDSSVDPHPLWLSVVQLQRFYAKDRLPKLSGALDAWDKLCKYSRTHGTEDRIKQRDLAEDNGRILRMWVVEEIARLESLRLRTQPVETARTASANADEAPSSDFRSMRWYGEVYSFTANQAPVVRLLYENWANGAPDVGDQTLKASVDPEAPPARLSSLFRGHEAWGTMIVPGGTKGTHRLAKPTVKLE